VKIRKQLREERKQELEEHVQAVNSLLQDVEAAPLGVFDSDSDTDDAWGGIANDPVDHEEEYIDEDKYTTVTVEAVDVSKEGLEKIVDSDEEGEEKVYKKVEEKDDRKKKWPKKEKKKKFRYETKAERKVTRGKQKAGNKARADARRGRE